MLNAILRFIASFRRTPLTETASPRRPVMSSIMMGSLESRVFLSASSTPPAAASSLEVSASGSHINVSWKDNSTRETGFEIDRGTSKSSLSKIGTVSASKTSFQDSPPKSNTTYYYTVRAYNSAGKASGPSAMSAKVSSTSSSSSSSSGSSSGSTASASMSKSSGISTGSGYGTQGPVSTPSNATVIYVGSSRSVKTIDSALNQTGKGKSVKIVVDPGTYSMSHHAIYGNVTITAANTSNEPVLKIAGSNYPTLYVNNNLVIYNVKTKGGSKAILLGSTTGANINAQNITMTDGGGIWRGSGGNNVYFRDNEVIGKPYTNVYGNFNANVNSCTIDDSGTGAAIPQGGVVSNGKVISGETAIRVMDVDNLTLIGVKTKPFFYKSGQEWKQDVQFRPSSKLIRLINCTFYNPDVGDMTWRSPARPVEEVDFINCTITKDVSLEAGAKLVKYEHTTIHGKMMNGTDSY